VAGRDDVSTENPTPAENPAAGDETGHRDLGIAGRLASQFINSPVTPLLMMAFLAIGILGLFFTPRQEDPKISVPMVDIFLQYPGASAEQVTSLVTEPLEELMSEIPGVRHVYSATQRGSNIVTVQFKVGEDMGESIVKVHDKLQSNLDRIPPGVSKPLVKPIGIDDVPVVTVTLWSEDVDDATLRTLGLDVLQRLEEVPNTGRGFVVGGRAEQIRVEILPERLAGYGIAPEQIAATIRAANSEQPAGQVEHGDNVYSVQTGRFIHSAEDVARLVVGVRQGMPVYVRDVARVFMAPEETRHMVNQFSGAAGTVSVSDAPAVTVAVAKKIGSNGVTVANAILEKLDALKGSLIPDNVHVEITRNYGATANQKVNELLEALFEAAIAVSVLCLIGLGLRAASVVIIIIPIVILITVWSAWVLDYTIDRVSLFALVFAIGILVDDATVVVENIFRRWLEAGQTSMRIAIDAVREVGNPTVLATLTIISAMLPMGFVSGMMGPYMRPIPVLGSSAMFFSLIAAFVFAPWMALRVRPKLGALKKAEEREARVREKIGRFYRPCMMPLCTNRTLGLLFLFGLVAATILSCLMFYTTAVAVKMLPFDNKPEFNVVVNMPEGTALPVTANVTRQIVEELRQIPEVTALQSYVGTASPFNFNGMVRHYYLRQRPWQADIQVMLLNKNDRERGSHEIAVAARHLITPLAERLGVRSVQVVEMPPGPPVLQTVVAEVYGPTPETRRQVARDLTAMFRDVPNIVDVDNYLTMPYEYWRFVVDMDKATRRGITVDTINRNLAMALGGHKLGDVKRGVVREPTYIVIQVPLPIRAQLDRLGSLPIPSASGNQVPLAELGKFVRDIEDPVIYHKDLRPIEYVTGEMEGRLGAPIYGMFEVEDRLKNYVAPDGVTFSGMPDGLIGPPKDDSRSDIEWTGEWTVTYETFRDMGIAFMAALVLIYGLIVWEFKNFALAGLIMAPIPLTLIGIIPGHWLLSAEFTATSMIGFIALAGIIVRNSILLVEFVKVEVEQGKPIREAVIAAGQVRMRPIFITALTLMAGAAAIVTDPIFEGMAVSLLFGTGVATILTLVVVPLGCISARNQFYKLACAEGHPVEPPADDTCPNGVCEPAEAPAAPAMPLWMRIYSKVMGALMWVFYVVRGIWLLVSSLVKGWLGRFRSPPSPPPPPPSGSGGDTPPPAPGPTSPPEAPAAVQGEESETTTAEEVIEPAPGERESGQAEPETRPPQAKKKTVRKKKAAKKKAAANRASKPSGKKKRRGIRLKSE